MSAQTISQENMTTNNDIANIYDCPAEDVLKLIAGKWKPQIFKMASLETLRFNSILRKLPGSNKQSISVALRELEDAGLLLKETVKQKPLHIEYSLTEKGRKLDDIFRQLSALSTRTKMCDS